MILLRNPASLAFIAFGLVTLGLASGSVEADVNNGAEVAIDNSPRFLALRDTNSGVPGAEGAAAIEKRSRIGLEKRWCPSGMGYCDGQWCYYEN